MLSIINWGKIVVIFSALERTEILLYTSLTLNILSIGFYFIQGKRIKTLKRDYAKLKQFTTASREIVYSIQQDVKRLFRMVEPNVENIENLQGQMSQVFELLGTVMGASDLMTGGFDSPVDRVEEIRERVKWERERRRLRKVDKSDSYEG
jgi:hypothetical protein